MSKMSKVGPIFLSHDRMLPVPRLDIHELYTAHFCRLSKRKNEEAAGPRFMDLGVELRPTEFIGE